MKCMETYPRRCGQSVKTRPFDLQLFAGEKTEAPTAKRQADARKKGQVGKSQEISAAFVIFSGFLSIKIFGSAIYDEIVGYMIYIFGHLMQPLDTESIMRIFLGIMVVLAKTALPIMLVIMVTGLAINLFQVGINFTTEPLEFILDNLNPITGFGRIFSKRALVELIKSLLKIIIIGYFIYKYIMAEVLQMPKLISADLQFSMAHMSEVIMVLAFQICGVIMVLAVCDFVYQKWQHLQELKMSKQDIKDEAIEDLSQMAKDAWQIIAKENRSKPQFFLSNNKPAYLSIKEQVDLQLLTPAMPQPTPLPPVAPQDSRIQTTVDGIDHIETKAILPEHLVVDQLDAIKKIADNGTLIAQQRFAVEQYKINSEAELEWLRIAKSFTLWGFLFSVPFLLTFYYIFANLAKGWREWQKDKLEYRQKEIEAAERITRSE